MYLSFLIFLNVLEPCCLKYGEICPEKNDRLFYLKNLKNAYKQTAARFYNDHSWSWGRVASTGSFIAPSLCCVYHGDWTVEQTVKSRMGVVDMGRWVDLQIMFWGFPFAVKYCTRSLVCERYTGFCTCTGIPFTWLPNSFQANYRWCSIHCSSGGSTNRKKCPLTQSRYGQQPVPKKGIVSS